MVLIQKHRARDVFFLKIGIRARVEPKHPVIFIEGGLQKYFAGGKLRSVPWRALWVKERRASGGNCRQNEENEELPENVLRG